LGYILGIDQGSSKTQVIIGDYKGNISGMGKSHGACHSVSGMDYAMEAITQAIGQAFDESGLSWQDVDIISAGLTGVDWDYEADLLRNELYKLSGLNNIILKNDCIIAMRAGSTNENRAVICAGSGLNCAIQKDGKEEFVYGFYIDDEFQGGYGLGSACLKAVFDSAIGLEEETVLTGMLIEFFKVKSVHELLHMKVTGKIKHDEYLYLPILLEQAAIDNDTVAVSVWERFGRQFGRYIAVGLKRFALLDTEVDVVLSGSIFKCKSPVLKKSVEDEIQKCAPKATIIDAEYEPVVGAYLLGLDHVCNKEFDCQNPCLRKSVKKYGLFR
jgi:N-acetylglucosamine kinase-like BadF-type ATPase